MLDIQVSNDPTELLADPNNSQKLIGQVKDGFSKAKQSRQQKEREWLRCIRAYNRTINYAALSKQPWRTNLAVDWSYNAVETAVAIWMMLLFPNQNDFFSIDPRKTDDPIGTMNADTKSAYLRYQFDESDFQGKYNRFLKSAAITGNAVLKISFRKDVQEGRVPQIDPMSGMLTRVRQEIVTHQGLYFEPIDILDFVFWPALGSVDQSMAIQRIYKPLQDVQANPAYINTEQIQKGEYYKSTGDGSDGAFRMEANKAFGVDDKFFDDKQDVELLEAWGDFTVGDQTFRNYVCTIANRKHLIRFEPNPFDYGLKPFVFLDLIPVPNQVYGYGILEPALAYQQLGNTFTNMIMDELKLKLHGMYKYEPDGIFDPENFISGPGRTIAVGDINNLVPLNPNMHLDIGWDQRSAVKAEFQEATGISPFQQGASPTDSYQTARSAVLQAQGSDKLVSSIAKHASRTLEQIIRIGYILINQFADPNDIADVTGVDPALLPQLVQLKEIKFNITGYETSMMRQQNLENLTNCFTGIARTPGVNFVNWSTATNRWFRANDIPDANDLLLPPPVIDMLQKQQLAQSLGIPPQAQIAAHQEEAGGPPGASPDNPQGPNQGPPPASSSAGTSQATQ